MTSSKKFGIDLDGCLVNFNKAYAKKFNERGYNLPEFAIESDQPAVWSYPEDIYGVPPEVVVAVWKEIHADENFWTRLDPINSDETVFHTLNNLQWDGHEVYYITNRSGVLAHNQAVEWLFNFGIDNPTVIMAPAGKGELAYHLGLDFVVDDSPAMLRDYLLAMKMHEIPNYPRVFRLVRPYNADFDPDGMPLTDVHSVAEAIALSGVKVRGSAVAA